MRTVKQIIEPLDKEQKQLLADIINFGYWGDADMVFSDGVPVRAEGCITDEAHEAENFKRREIPHRLRQHRLRLSMIAGH